MGIQKIDNIVDDFDAIVSVTESIYDNYDAANKMLEAQGKSASVANLKTMVEQLNNAASWRRGELQQLRQEQQKLVSSGVIAKWSQEWYELEAKIHDVSAEVHNTQAEVYELRQQIREVNWKGFTDGIEAIDTLNDNLENTLSLIDDMESFAQDDSLLNANGILKLGLYGKQLGNARQAVADYEYAIKTLNKELKIGNITQGQYDEQLKELNDGRWEAVSSVKKYRDSILELVKDGINKETEAMRKLTDTRKEALSKQKEYYDWNKKVQDQNKQINSIEAQIQALQGDDSIEAQQKLHRLQSQKQELEDELKESQIDRQYDIVSEGYDNMMEEFEQLQENELYLLNSSLDAQNQAIQNMLATAKDSYQTVYDELGALSDAYGITLSEDLTEPWKSAESALAEYKKALEELQANISINTNGVPNVSTNSANVNFAESSPAAPDNNVKQNYEAQKAAAAVQASASANAKISNVPETLRYGTSSNNVRILQNALNALGYNAGAVDGSFGDQTLAAVRRFQKDNGMAGDGIVGPNTKARFRARGYEKGTKNAKSGLAYFDDKNGKLDLGSEIVVTNTGVLRQMEGGEWIFNRERVQRLWEMSGGNSSESPLPSPYDWNSNTSIVSGNSQSIANMIQPKKVSGGDINIHYDSLLNVNGDINKETFPGVQKMCDKACNYTINYLRKYSKR